MTARNPSGEDAKLRADARNTLLDLFGDMAASEALTRALFKERSGERDQAHMWLDVYRLICEHEDGSVPVEIMKV
jgi:hypothetical protein